MNIVIVHGKQGCGKTRRSEQLKKHFKCKCIIDDWDGESQLKDGDLAITCQRPPFNISGAKVVDFVSTKIQITKN